MSSLNFIQLYKNMKQKTIGYGFSLMAALMFSGCVTPEAYMKEYKEATGIDPMKDGMGGVPCEHYAGVKNQEQYMAARLKCAQAASGKPFISENVLSYSELTDGYELQCYFGGYDRHLILDRLSKGVGLVQPIFIYGDDGGIIVDWPATEKLIEILRKTVKLNVKPISESKAYAKLLLEYRPKVSNGSLLSLVQAATAEPSGDLHYQEILSKLPPADYFVAASHDIVHAMMNGEVSTLQEYFKSVGAAKNADVSNKTKFTPDDVRKMASVNMMLENLIRKNAETVKLDILLTERLKAFNPKEQTFMQRTIEGSVPRGCQVADLTNRFAERQIANAQQAGTDNKTFGQRLSEMFVVDSSNGRFELSLSNEQAWRDQYINERNKLREMKAAYSRSMNERYVKVTEKLTPFAGRAFQQFKLTGYTQSNKL